MIRMSVVYPATEGDHVRPRLLPGAARPAGLRTWYPTSAEIDKGVDGPNVAAVHLTFESLDALHRPWPRRARPTSCADVANYTTIAPVLQTSELVG